MAAEIGLFDFDVDFVVIVVRKPALPAFQEVIRRGLSFEHGEPASFHKFAEDLGKIVPTGTPLPGTLFV